MWNALNTLSTFILVPMCYFYLKLLKENKQLKDENDMLRSDPVIRSYYGG